MSSDRKGDSGTRAPIATPAMSAAAWATWKTRGGHKLGPGPAFREAIEAALQVYEMERINV